MQTIVVPGEKLNNNPVRIENTTTDKNGTYASILGFFDNEKQLLTPLEALWTPRQDDTVIGVIEEDKGNIFLVNLNAPYRGMILSKFLEVELGAGDIIVASIKEVERGGVIMLMRPAKLEGGKIMSVKPSRIPRIIGKANTMIKQITDSTRTNMMIGLNGLIWMNGGDLETATAAVLKIEEEAHTSGLTERIKTMLDSAKKVQ